MGQDQIETKLKNAKNDLTDAEMADPQDFEELQERAKNAREKIGEALAGYQVTKGE